MIKPTDQAHRSPHLWSEAADEYGEPRQRLGAKHWARGIGIVPSLPRELLVNLGELLLCGLRDRGHVSANGG